ncbi:MAG: bifunctional diguanylate cyclase/phosphodiesterase [Gammaproteobacteria bacterium]
MLADHTLLLSSLRKELKKKHRDQGMLAILIIGLEGVTKLDGVMGYQAGDQLQQQVTERLKSALRETDIFGFIGREELGCILPSLTSEGHATLAAYKILRILEQSFMIEDRQVVVNVSLGMAYYPEHGNDADILMKHANVAMHNAKRNKTGLSIFSIEHDLFSQLQLEIQAGLNGAIQDNELFLHYQPQLNLHTRQIDAAETLLRWNLPNRGAIPPADILAVAENTGMISLLTGWVLNTALRQQANFNRAGLDLNISVNFSARNLMEPELPEFVDQTLRTWNVPPDKITVEITESAMIEDEKRALNTLLKLKDIGVKLSIDDFGTGYASMTYLRKLPVDEIKVDVSFVRSMLTVKGDERIVRSIIALGHNFDLEVVAEGVEDRQTLERLVDLGCDRVQGYYLGSPVPEEEFIKHVSLYNFNKPSKGVA